MLLWDQGAREFYTPAGYHGTIDALGQTADNVQPYDHLRTADGRRYEAKYVKEIWQLDNFIRRDVALTRINELYQALPSSTATWQTGPADPRSRLKTLIDTYVTDANILKDDGVTQAAWACLFANPPYPIALEFRGTSLMNGLYVVDQPDSTPLIDDVTQAPYGYDERVPIHIVTVDSTNCHGDMLHWTMERELRSILQTYPTGSQRGLERRTSQDVHLGSMTLYDTAYTVTWRRDTAT
jgi:hypothetical protein